MNLIFSRKKSQIKNVQRLSREVDNLKSSLFITGICQETYKYERYTYQQGAEGAAQQLQVAGPLAAVVVELFHLSPQLGASAHPSYTWGRSAAAGTTTAGMMCGRCGYMAVSCTQPPSLLGR